MKKFLLVFLLHTSCSCSLARKNEHANLRVRNLGSENHHSFTIYGIDNGCIVPTCLYNAVSFASCDYLVDSNLISHWWQDSAGLIHSSLFPEMCLQAAHGNVLVDGSNMRFYPCDGTKVNQQFEPVSASGTIKLKSRDDLCVVAHGSPPVKDVSEIIFKKCDIVGNRAIWRTPALSSSPPPPSPPPPDLEDGSFSIYGIDNGCVVPTCFYNAVSFASCDYPVDSNLISHWRQDSTGLIHSSLFPEMCLQAAHGNVLVDGSNMRFYPCDEHKVSQQFEPVSSSGTIKLKSRSDLCVVAHGSPPVKDVSEIIFKKCNVVGNRAVWSAPSVSLPPPPPPPPPPDCPSTMANPNDLYQPLNDVVLNRYCRELYGESVSAVRAGGYDWRCQNNDQSISDEVSIADVCARQFNHNYVEVLLGGTEDDWACVNWEEARYSVVPVIVVASDFVSDRNAMSGAVESVTATIERVREWYENKMSSGKTFRLARPILRLSSQTGEYWNELSCKTAIPQDRPQECLSNDPEAKRYEYLYQATGEAQLTSLGVSPQDITVPIFVFTGPDASPFWLGAAAAGQFSVNPPNVAVCPVNSDTCGLYSIAHEIGHSFNLKHSCENLAVPEPQCYNGIMENPSDVLNAVLFEFEQDILNDSCFFRA